MGKKIPLWILVLVVFVGLHLTVIFGWFVAHLEEGGTKLGKLGPVVLAIAHFPKLVHQAFVEVKSPSPLLIENRFPEIDGFKKNGIVQNGAIQDAGYLLLSAYDPKKKQSAVQLIRIGDQQVLHEWAPDIRKLAESQKTESTFFDLNDMQASRYRITHPMLMEDGGLVFKGSGGSPLFKVNARSTIEWEIDGAFHHSIEKDAEGHLWIPSILEPTSYNKDKFDGFRDDAVTQVSRDGKVLFKKSVAKILEENGYRGLLFGAGEYDREAVHLNAIQPALDSTPYWEKGDLLLSIRNRSALVLYRPGTNKIVWLKLGPWLNQHDADFVGQSKISLFGNDVIRKKKSYALVEGHNEIYLFDLVDGSVSTPYSKALKALDVRSCSEGRQDILANGDVFVEETDHGRCLRLSPDKAVWEFTAKVDDHSNGLTSWSRYLTKEQIANVLPVFQKDNPQKTPD